MEKSNPTSTTQKVNGGTVTTRGRNIEIKGVSGYHFGQTYVYGASSPSTFHRPSPSTANKDKKQKQSTSHGTQKPSRTIATGATFQQVGSLTLNSSEIQAIQNCHSHTIFANERVYQATQQATSSSKVDSSQQTNAPSFKR